MMTIIDWVDLSNPDYIFEECVRFATNFIPKLILAFILLYIGRMIIRLLLRFSERIMIAREYEVTLITFLKSFLNIGFQSLLIFGLLALIGFNTASIVTAIGAAGLAIGLALQGSLSNFAGGVLILLFKPFKVGDLIEANLYKGKVKEINVLYTILITLDGKKIVVPNGNLSNNPVVNFSSEENRRVDIIIYLEHGQDVQKAIELIENEVVPKVDSKYNHQKAEIGIGALNDMGIKVEIFFWVFKEDYVKTLYFFNTKINEVFIREGVLFSVGRR